MHFANFDFLGLDSRLNAYRKYRADARLGSTFGKNRVLVSHGNSDSVGAVGTTGPDKSMRNSHISRLGTDKAKTGAEKQDLQH